MIAAITAASVTTSVLITFVFLRFHFELKIMCISVLVPLLVAPIASNFAATQMLHAHRLNERLLHLLDHDQMTQLLNRSAFFARLRVSPGQNSTIIMFDIDRFKSINDTYGHYAGDAAICLVAEALRAGIGSDGFAARLGGEEFVIFGRNMSIEEAHTRAEAIRKSVSDLSAARGDQHPHFTVSAGIASFSQGCDIDEAIRAADDALYQSKELGRNRVTVRAAA